MKIQMTHEWQIYKIWHNYDRFMTFIWQIYDRYVRMIDLWQLYDSFLTDLWHFYANDSFMIVLWQIYDSFVKIVGPTLDKSTELLIQRPQSYFLSEILSDSFFFLPAQIEFLRRFGQTDFNWSAANSRGNLVSYRLSSGCEKGDKGNT